MFTVTAAGNSPVAASCNSVPAGIVGAVGVIPIHVMPLKVPAPVRLAVCVGMGALSVTVRVPLRVPRVVGVNVTEMVHDPPPAKVEGANGQVVDVFAKSPDVEMFVIVRATVWLFVNIVVRALLVVVRICAGNDRLLGLKVIPTPVPFNCAVCGELLASSVTVSVPPTLPNTAGVKVTEIVHVDLAASVFGDSGQVVDAAANAPEVAMLLMVSGTVW